MLNKGSTQITNGLGFQKHHSSTVQQGHGLESIDSYMHHDVHSSRTQHRSEWEIRQPQSQVEGELHWVKQQDFTSTTAVL